jgi:S1-C subfamily serine protease
MRNDRPLSVIPAGRVVGAALLRIALAASAALALLPARAETPALDRLLSAVVHLKTTINRDGRTVETLGREREGSAIVIDADGLLLTIGYLMVEAESAEVTTSTGRAVPANVVGYDHETGFGLLRAMLPLDVQPLALGHSADLKPQDPVVIAGYGGPGRIAPALVASRRAFAGAWEYLLDDAIFTSPPYPDWSGTALIDHSGKLVGVGSLMVEDASGRHEGPGNMFVPIDRLPPILADLIADGRASGPGRPWLGVITRELGDRLIIAAVVPGSPADKAGLRHGDLIVGVAGEQPGDMADFYRKVYAQGAAGASVPLDVMQGGERRHVDVKSVNRLDVLRLKSTY